MSGLILVTSVGDARGGGECAAVCAAGLAEDGRAALLVEVGRDRPRRAGLAATADARAVEERLASTVPEGAPAARGRVCSVAAAADAEGEALVRHVAATARADGRPCVVSAPPRLLLPLAEDPEVGAGAALLRADLPAAAPLTALVVRALTRRDVRAKVMKRAPGRLAALFARAGLAAPGSRAGGAGTGRMAGRLRAAEGQALPLALGAALVLVVGALAMVAIAGALAGKGRLQRSADLAALSAARSLRDDLPRRLAPARLPNGIANPAHLSRRRYLARARRAGEEAAEENGVAEGRVRISFPDRSATAPLSARARVLANLDAPGRPRVAASATAEAAAPVATGGIGGPAFGSGGGYSGPLVYRQSEGMRPDVADAYDSMAAAAAADGVTLIVVSGFRSDAEQAQLFAANPDPRMVAPPGQSLHRCATELDLGPSAAYGWLAANARRFGFEQRYSWEAWHYGFIAGPDPCSDAGNAVRGPGDDGLVSGSLGLPGFVPATYRAPLLAAAARWGVSAALLAAQLMAESGFDAGAVSPAGAAGIAQFMPATAAAYGLGDPFDAEAAIDAQAHLMSDLLGQFGAPELALAAYNAGPAPVAACGCVPGYPETQAYVARIMALLGGAGAVLAPPLEVRLVD